MKEYGGYLRLELNDNAHYWKHYDNNSVKLNSGRAAIYCAVEMGKFERVFIPAYTCDTVAQFLISKNIGVVYYNITNTFDPIIHGFTKNDVLVWTNYYGILSNKNKMILKKYKNVIFDNTQAFFTKPLVNSYTVYSFRKFFGVSDGALLIYPKGNKCDLTLARDKSSETSLFLLTTIENGTNNSYSDSLKNEERISKSDILGMSQLTDAILRNVNYNQVKKRRRDNFEYLDKRLCKINELSDFIKHHLPSDIPMIYPLLIKNENLRSILISEHVYVPQWWKYLINSNLSNDFEKYLSKYLIPVPIDQRYTFEDMEMISKIIEKNI